MLLLSWRIVIEVVLIGVRLCLKQVVMNCTLHLKLRFNINIYMTLFFAKQVIWSLGFLLNRLVPKVILLSLLNFRLFNFRNQILGSLLLRLIQWNWIVCIFRFLLFDCCCLNLTHSVSKQIRKFVFLIVLLNCFV